MAYAQGTTVTVEKSKAEIERVLRRYGADAFGYFADADRAVIQFRAAERYVRFVLPLPPLEDFRHDRNFRRRTDSQQTNAHDAEARRRWRALALAIKAKLEVVESEIATFEQEFAVHIVLPDGSTVGDRLVPQIAAAYDSGKMPESLLELPAPAAPTERLALPVGSDS